MLLARIFIFTRLKLDNKEKINNEYYVYISNIKS